MQQNRYRWQILRKQVVIQTFIPVLRILFVTAPQSLRGNRHKFLLQSIWLSSAVGYSYRLGRRWSAFIKVIR